MKTKEEIINHLLKVGYTEQATDKIMGYLIGSGLKEEQEVLTYKKGLHDWDNFWNWLNSDTETVKSIELVDSLIDDVMTASITNDCTLLTNKLDFLYAIRKELLEDED